MLNLNTKTDKDMIGAIQLPNKKIKLVNTTILVTFRFDFAIAITELRLFLSILTSFVSSTKSVSLSTLILKFKEILFRRPVFLRLSRIGY
jgi:hypothetical protein